MAETLKPCPFCGGEASADGTTRYSKSHEAWWDDGEQVLETFHVNCVKCGATSRGLFGQRTQADAIAAWNTRPAPTEAQIEAAARAIEADAAHIDDGNAMVGDLNEAALRLLARVALEAARRV